MIKHLAKKKRYSLVSFPFMDNKELVNAYRSAEQALKLLTVQRENAQRQKHGNVDHYQALEHEALRMKVSLFYELERRANA